MICLKVNQVDLSRLVIVFSPKGRVAESDQKYALQEWLDKFGHLEKFNGQ